MTTTTSDDACAALIAAAVRSSTATVAGAAQRLACPRAGPSIEGLVNDQVLVVKLIESRAQSVALNKINTPIDIHAA